MIVDVFKHRDLLTSLVRRQFQLRYRQSAVGFAWAILPTLATLAAAGLLFRGVLGVDSEGHPYALFTLAALIPWIFFVNSLTFGVPSIIIEKLMITRIKFPRAVLPLAQVGVAFLDFLIAAPIFVVAAFITREGIPSSAVWVVVPLLIEIFFVTGAAMLLSAMNVFARDVKLVVPLLVQVWFLVTPVMYSLDTVKSPTLRPFFEANPMAGLMETFRRVLVEGGAPNWETLAPAIIGALLVFGVGAWYFSAVENRFADVI